MKEKAYTVAGLVGTKAEVGKAAEDGKISSRLSMGDKRGPSCDAER